MTQVRRQAKKIVIGSAGGLVVLIGVVLIPYPGPGWLIVFFGLTILATEFMWAQGVLDTVRDRYNAWQSWVMRQPVVVKLGIGALTLSVVVVTIWLFNGYGIANAWLGLEQDWLASPFVRMDATP